MTDENLSLQETLPLLPKKPPASSVGLQPSTYASSSDVPPLLEPPTRGSSVLHEPVTPPRRPLSTAVQRIYGSDNWPTPGVARRFFAYAVSGFTIITWYTLFALLAGDAMGEGVPTTILQALAITIQAWLTHLLGVVFMLYIFSVEPFIWKATHAIVSTGDLAYDFMLAQAHPHALLKYALTGPTDAQAALPVYSRMMRTLVGTPINEGDDVEISAENAFSLWAASIGLLYGLPRFAIYALFSPLAAVPGIATTFMLWAVGALTTAARSYMRLGAYAGVGLAFAVQAANYWLTPANQDHLKGTPFEVFARAVTHPPAMMKALWDYFYTQRFGTRPVVTDTTLRLSHMDDTRSTDTTLNNDTDITYVAVPLSSDSDTDNAETTEMGLPLNGDIDNTKITDSTLSFKTILFATIATLLGEAYRLLLFVMAAVALVPGLAICFAYYAELIITPMIAAAIRLISLAVLIQAAEIEIARFVVAEVPQEEKSGHVAPGLVTEKAGLWQAVAQGLANPHPTAKYLLGRLTGWSIFQAAPVDNSADEYAAEDAMVLH